MGTVSAYKLPLAALLVLLIGSSATAVYLYKAPISDVNAIASRSADLDKQISNLTNQTDSLKTQVLQLQTTISQLQATSQAQASEIQRLKSEVAQLQSPALSLHVDIVGTRFSWSFTCNSPCDSSRQGILMVPHDTTIILNVTSSDVFHSLAIPALQVKTDAIPGRSNVVWFSAPVGTYRIFCIELCGPGHSQMTATLIVF